MLTLPWPWSVHSAAVFVGPAAELGLHDHGFTGVKLGAEVFHKRGQGGADVGASWFVSRPLVEPWTKCVIPTSAIQDRDFESDVGNE